MYTPDTLEPPRWGGSYEYPQYMILAEIKQIMYTPATPVLMYHYENTPIQIYRKFHLQKLKNFR